MTIINKGIIFVSMTLGLLGFYFHYLNPENPILLGPSLILFGLVWLICTGLKDARLKKYGEITAMRKLKREILDVSRETFIAGSDGEKLKIYGAWVADRMGHWKQFFHNKKIHKIIASVQNEYALLHKPGRYRLGNMGVEYELQTKYLHCALMNTTWDELATNTSDWKGEIILLRSPGGNVEISLIVQTVLDIAAFPMSLRRDERSEAWRRFAKVSLVEKPDDIFIIPMH